MKLKKFIIPIAAVLASMTVLLTACGTSSEGGSDSEHVRTVKIAYLPITHALPVYELSQSDNVKVELVKYGSWPELMDALNSGQVDGASVLIELAMQAQSQNIGLKAAALGHTSGNVIVVSNEIQSAANLKGKTFAIPHRSSSHNILLQEMLEQNGLTIDDVQVTELSPAEMPSALVSGQIQGYCVAEPFGSVAVTGGYGKVLYQSDELWDHSICCALVFNDKFLNENSELANQVIDAYQQAGFELSDKEEALSVAKNFLKQPDNVLQQSLEWIDFSDLTIEESAYNDLVARMQKYHISENPPSYEAFVYRTE